MYLTKPHTLILKKDKSQGLDHQKLILLNILPLTQKRNKKETKELNQETLKLQRV